MKSNPRKTQAVLINEEFDCIAEGEAASDRENYKEWLDKQKRREQEIEDSVLEAAIDEAISDFRSFFGLIRKRSDVAQNEPTV